MCMLCPHEFDLTIEMCNLSSFSTKQLCGHQQNTDHMSSTSSSSTISTNFCGAHNTTSKYLWYLKSSSADIRVILPGSSCRIQNIRVILETNSVSYGESRKKGCRLNRRGRAVCLGQNNPLSF
jgi:hypothetical protein